jgi:hypothetical protein
MGGMGYLAEVCDTLLKESWPGRIFCLREFASPMQGECVGGGHLSTANHIARAFADSTPGSASLHAASHRLATQLAATGRWSSDWRPFL